MRSLRTHKALDALPVQRSLRVVAEGPVTLGDVADAAKGDPGGIAVKVEVTCDPRELVASDPGTSLRLCVGCGWYADLCDCGLVREARDRQDTRDLDAETEEGWR